ncbi:MAG TPA: hypothetical protein VGJ20_20510 [Xanthobacteraceae bacterium]|jgi:hypothetical protein
MPKKTAPPMATDKEMNDWLTERGYDLSRPQQPPAAQPGTTQAGSSASAAGAPGVLDRIRSALPSLGFSEFSGEPATPSDLGRPPTYGEMDWQQAAGQGAARKAASLGVGAARLAGRALPEDVRGRVGGAIEGIPGVRRLEEFADAPAEGPAEAIGSGLTDVAAGGMLPAMRLGTLAANVLPKTSAVTQMLPAWVNPLGTGAQLMRGTGTGYIRNPAARWAAKTAGNVAEGAGKGALAGAVTNPDDPAAGAEAGALGGVAGQGVGAAMRSPVGQWIGSHAARWGPGILAEEAMRHGGVSPYVTGPLGLGYLIHQYNSPVGSALGRFGHAVFDRGGRFLGYVPAVAGAETARATSDRPMVTMPQRAEPPYDPGASDAEPRPPQR